MVLTSHIRTLCLMTLLPCLSPSLAGDFSLETTPLLTETTSSSSLKKATRSTTPPPAHPPLRAPDMTWVNTTLANMTLDQKIGQMLMPGFANMAEAKAAVTDFHVTGFLFNGNGNEAATLRNHTNELQAHSPTPLLFSIDCEAGLGARAVDATRFPLNMGITSAGDLDLTREQGRITARECRAVGIQMGFGPCVDVNTEPVNPIIGIRSYSDNPHTVAQFAEAYIRGANEEGLLTCLKHYPGHGAATGDSHDQLVTINIPVSEIRNNHTSPYASLINVGLGDSVMSAHVWYPAFDNTPAAFPATISPALMTGELRSQLQFTGAAISDSYGMAGLLQAAGGSTYLAVQKGVQAGLDIILHARPIAESFNAIKDGVQSNLFTEARIDESVRRILIMKSRVGMPENTTVSPTEPGEILLHPRHLEVSEELGAKAPAGRVGNGVLPLNPSQKIAVFAFPFGSSIFYNYDMSWFKNRFQTHFPPPLYNYYDGLPLNMSTVEAGIYALSEINTPQVVIVINEWDPILESNKQGPARLINELRLQNPATKIILVSLGSPYLINSFPQIQNFICGFGRHYATQQAIADILKGDRPFQTDFPVYVESLTPPAGIKDYFLY